LDPGGTASDFDMLADTGNPFAVVVSAANLARLRSRVAPNVTTNFGALTGGWLRVLIPGIGFNRQVIGYGSDAVVAAARASSPDFSGLVGLPLLRMMEYGGDANGFWVRPGAAAPLTP
jgi:hypothetical protein